MEPDRGIAFLGRRIHFDIDGGNAQVNVRFIRIAPLLHRLGPALIPSSSRKPAQRPPRDAVAAQTSLYPALGSAMPMYWV